MGKTFSMCTPFSPHEMLSICVYVSVSLRLSHWNVETVPYIVHQLTEGPQPSPVRISEVNQHLERLHATAFRIDDYMHARCGQDWYKTKLKLCWDAVTTTRFTKLSLTRLANYPIYTVVNFDSKINVRHYIDVTWDIDVTQRSKALHLSASGLALTD